MLHVGLEHINQSGMDSEEEIEKIIRGWQTIQFNKKVLKHTLFHPEDEIYTKNFMSHGSN